MMRRRDFLAAAGTAALSIPRLSRAARGPLRIGVVGAGILGTSIALHLAEAGAQVTLLEAEAPAAGATRNSYAWLNAFVSDSHYRDLRLASLARWRLLDHRYHLGITWGGYLNWGIGAEGIATVSENLRQLEGSNAPAIRISAEDVIQRAPYLTPGLVDAALLAPSDGHLDPVDVTQRLVQAARNRGVQFSCPAKVDSMTFRSGRLAAVGTSTGTVAIDRLIIAAGTATPNLVRMAGVELELAHAPGILAHTVPVERFATLTHEGPGEASFKQLPNGRIVAYDAPHPPDLPWHSGIRAAPMDFGSEQLRRDHGERMLSHLSRFCPRIRVEDFDRLTLGYRPMPTDDRPIVGALSSSPDIYVAVTHSGVTLAAILGQLVAEELTQGTRAAVLAPYRPERFARAVAHMDSKKAPTPTSSAWSV